MKTRYENSIQSYVYDIGYKKIINNKKFSAINHYVVNYVRLSLLDRLLRKQGCRIQQKFIADDGAAILVAIN